MNQETHPPQSYIAPVYLGKHLGTIKLAALFVADVLLTGRQQRRNCPSQTGRLISYSPARFVPGAWHVMFHESSVRSGLGNCFRHVADMSW
jgi:hypothetical protein